MVRFSRILTNALSKTRKTATPGRRRKLPTPRAHEVRADARPGIEQHDDGSLSRASDLRGRPGERQDRSCRLTEQCFAQVHLGRDPVGEACGQVGKKNAETGPNKR